MRRWPRPSSPIAWRAALTRLVSADSVTNRLPQTVSSNSSLGTTRRRSLSSTVEIKLTVLEDEDQDNPPRHPRSVHQSLNWDGRTSVSRCSPSFLQG